MLKCIIILVLACAAYEFLMGFIPAFKEAFRRGYDEALKKKGGE